ncbi:Hypothetical protein, putative [Bodo saltans]|uniref:Uncharacterized protein n=1 Tax=Bodo saltans TaxID=75058 RepID=A0A0S4JCI2_BODSA|nr:Hypothetical protein, putative [Bodo saltans]|eukprot:CUG87206.1 Hypothetical protein, putative [Bodo saltans]
MSLDHSSRRECVATAFQLLLKHEGECRGMEVRRLSPNVFSWGALALTGKHRVDRLEANLRADIAAEFLIDEAAARQGITKEFAVHQFDKDADICSLGEGDFLYFFGVENDTNKPSAPEDDVIIGGVAAADLLLFRSVPLISEPLAFLATFLDARLLFVRSMRVLVDAEKLSRRELQDVEITSRDELQSTSRRRMYAAALRTRLAEDRKLAQQEYALKSVDDDSKKDAVELQNLKWEQEAVQRSIEATRDAAVKLELCLQDTHHYVRRCGDHFGVFKQYKDTLLQLCANEVQDDVQSSMAAIHTHHDKWGGRFDAIEDKVREVGRMMLLTSAGARGRAHHAATLEACNVAHKRTHDGEPLDFSWLLDTARPRVMATDDDETIARWMLRDPTIFVPQSVLGPHQSLQLTKDSVGVIQRVFNRLASISAVDAATVTNCSSLPSAKFAGSSKTPANSNAPSISLPVFRDFCKATGLCSAVKDSLTLEFESFCPVDRNMMDYEGWLQCLASQSTLMFPRFAANISRPLLMDIMCTSLLVPWLHADASRGDLSTSPIPHSSDAAGSRSVVVRSMYSQRRQPLCFDIKELAEECFGALLASHRTLEIFLQYFFCAVR